MNIKFVIEDANNKNQDSSLSPIESLANNMDISFNVIDE